MGTDTLEVTGQTLFMLLRILLGSCQYSPRHCHSCKRLCNIRTVPVAASDT